jgi:hypothetical protein
MPQLGSMTILVSFGWFSGISTAIQTTVNDDDKKAKHWGVQRPEYQPDAASVMILKMVFSTSFATPLGILPPNF